MFARKALTTVAVALMAIVSPVAMGPHGPGAATALADDCKPKVICEQIYLVVWSWKVCWKIDVDIFC